MKRIKASMLYYTLIFSIVLGLSVSLFMNVFLNFDTINIRIDNSKELLLNIQSGVEVISTYPDEFPMNTKVEIDLFSEQADSLTILRRMYGALNIVTLLAHRNGQYQRAVVQLGWKKLNNPISLYLANNAFPLSICGETKIEGEALLPSGQIKRAYIEGKNYIGNQLIYGKTSVSKGNIPSLDKDLFSNIMQQREVSYLYDSLVFVEAIGMEENSFSSKRWVIKSDQFLKLDNQIFEGNMVIISSKGIEIGRNTQFKDVVFIAPVIKLMDDVRGEFQCIAMDTLTVGNNVELYYPSNLMLMEKEGELGKLLKVGENTLVEGAVCIIPSGKTSQFSKGSDLVLKKNIKVKGIVYSPYRLTISSGIEIMGSLYCKEAELKTPSAVYTNHFLDFKVIPGMMEEYYVQTFKYPNSRSSELIKWLN